MQGDQGFKAREPRQKVLIRARMRAGGSFVDVCIRDFSRRGLLLHSDAPPVRGTYIEIVRTYGQIVGRVVWTRGAKFGVSTGADVDPGLLTGDTSARPLAPGDPAGPGGLERRQRPRVPASTPGERFERSRALSSAIQFVLVSGACAMAAILMVSIVYQTLSPTFDRVTAGLAGGAEPKV